MAFPLTISHLKDVARNVVTQAGEGSPADSTSANQATYEAGKTEPGKTESDNFVTKGLSRFAEEYKKIIEVTQNGSSQSNAKAESKDQTEATGREKETEKSTLTKIKDKIENFTMTELAITFAVIVALEKAVELVYKSITRGISVMKQLQMMLKTLMAEGIPGILHTIRLFGQFGILVGKLGWLTARGVSKLVRIFLPKTWNRCILKNVLNRFDNWLDTKYNNWRDTMLKHAERFKGLAEEPASAPKNTAKEDSPPTDEKQPPDDPSPPRKTSTEPGIPVPETVDAEAATLPAVDAVDDPSAVLKPVEPTEYSSVVDEIFNQGITVFQPEVTLKNTTATTWPTLSPKLEPTVSQPAQAPKLVTETVRTPIEMGPPTPIFVRQMNAWDSLPFWKEISFKNVLLNGTTGFKAEWARIPGVLSQHLGIPAKKITSDLMAIEKHLGLRYLSDKHSTSTRFDLALRAWAGRVYVSAMIRSLHTGKPVPAPSKLLRSEIKIRSSISRTQQELVRAGLLQKSPAMSFAMNKSFGSQYGYDVALAGPGLAAFIATLGFFGGAEAALGATATETAPAAAETGRRIIWKAAEAFPY